MASFVLKDVSVVVNYNSTDYDISKYVTSATVNYSAEILENTAMQGSGFRSRVAGLKDWSMAVEWNQDFAADATLSGSISIDKLIHTIVGEQVTLTVKHDDGSTSATNPRYYGYCFLDAYSPVGGGVGEVSTSSATFQGNGVLTRDEDNDP